MSDKLNTSDNFTCTILAKRDYVVAIYNVTKHAAHKGLNIEKHLYRVFFDVKL